MFVLRLETTQTKQQFLKSQNPKIKRTRSPELYRNSCFSESFLKKMSKWKNIVWTAPASADRVLGRPESRRKSKKKRQTCARSPRTQIFVEKLSKRYPKGTRLGLFWTPSAALATHLGSQSVPQSPKRSTKWSLESALAPRGARMIPKGVRDLENGAHVVPKWG